MNLLKLKHQSRLLSAFSLGVLLIACGGGGGDGGDDTPVTQNFSAGKLIVETADPMIGYPMKVSVTIAANEDMNDVSVSLFALDKHDDPTMEVRQIPLGSQSIVKMEAGTRSYEFDVSIPSSAEFPGSYYIGVIVDPVEEVAETNEDDNTAIAETELLEGTPNILLTELALDRTALIINTDTYEQQVPGTAGNVHNADAGGTITVGANGLAVEETIEIEGFAKLRIMRTDNGSSHVVPLYLWNSDAGRYINAFGIDPETGNDLGEEEWLPLGTFTPQLAEKVGEDVTLNDVNRDSAHINFYFPGRLGSELEFAMRYASSPRPNNLPAVPPPDLTFEDILALRGFLSNLPSSGIEGDESEAQAVMEFAVCVEIRPVDSTIIDFLPDDNDRCSPLAIALPPLESRPPTGELGGYVPLFTTPSNPLTAGDGFETKGGGSAFGYALDFGATATADYRGYIEEMRAGVPLAIFGSDLNFMSITVRAQLVPDYEGKPDDEKSGYTIEVRFLDQLLDSVDLPPGSSPPINIVSYSKEAPDPEVEQQFFVGPIPVIAGASVAGNFGVDYHFGFTESSESNYTFGNTVTLFSDIEATLFAAVGNKLYAVGVEGVLKLLDESLTLASIVAIEVLQPGNDDGIAEFIITQSQEINNVFTGPRGALNLFAKYSVPTVVKCSWGLFTGVCPSVKTIKAAKNIWRSPALFELEDVLYKDTDVQLDVVAINGKPPLYFVP